MAAKKNATKKLTIAAIAASSAPTKERFVEKPISWEVIDGDGVSHHYSGYADILATGTRTWASARAYTDRINDLVKTGGVSIGQLYISEFALFDGVKMTVEQVAETPDTFVVAVLAAIYDVNPHLLAAQQEAAKQAGNP